MTPQRHRSLAGRRAIVTGAAKRIGATIAARLHDAGATVGIHYRHSAAEAAAFRDRLNDSRKNSAEIFRADLSKIDDIHALLASFTGWCGGLDILVNNASVFYPTELGSITPADWEELTGSNLKGPLFLSQAAYPWLSGNAGAIVNIVDIHARRPLRRHVVYGVAKAGLVMLTRSLAREMAPEVRVNGVSPGAILWPEDGIDDAGKKAILKQIPLARTGDPEDIADCVLYLIGASYITGEIVTVDGGRSIGW
jgi:pteridine reductase